jgi:DNA repair protein RadA/Sms
MSKKTTTVFVCQECGNESPKWVGQCICGAWNSMVEEKVLPPSNDDRRGRSLSESKSNPVKLSSVKSGDQSRINTGIGELNRVLGGGLVKGSLTLISGEPGIGKSTLIIQAAAEIAEKGLPVLYVTGEESEEQIKMRADRVCKGNIDNLYIFAETNMESIVGATENLKPGFIVIDSIQTMYTSELSSAPGSVSQVRGCGNELMRIGKVRNIPVFIVAHVTKSGDLAGPKIIEHLVDCVLSFTGERSQEIRILRANKNRFGTTSEIGAFEMAEEGLLQIENLSGSFLEGMEDGVEGSMATAVYEGTRPLLLEVQALTSPTNIGFARRTAIGVDNSRLSMLLAVLDRKAGLSLIDQDVYINIVGGLKPEGTSTDLAIAMAIYSTAKRIPCGKKTLAIGEIGLTGDLRSVQNADKIVKEAARMGFEKVIMPDKNARRISSAEKNIKLVGVKSLAEAIRLEFF